MCGLSALIGKPEVDVAPYIRAMTDIIRHRGPDDEGYALIPDRGVTPVFLGGEDTPQDCYRDGAAWAPRSSIGNNLTAPARIALGHRRLSILDLSPAGHQPMADTEGRQIIVYNGEVYNFPELRAELEAKGYSFRSHSDTEVVLAAWRHWGRDCLSRMNGMFAFVILDLEQWRVFAARDRFGIKPLYWWTSPAGFVAFASEIKQFTSLPGWQPSLNASRAYDYLNWAVSDHTPQTMFAGVSQLTGGEYVDVDIEAFASGNVHPQRWYTLQAAECEMPFNLAHEHFRKLFEDAVRLRLRADVPVGTCLSGGLDSSAIACAMHRVMSSNDSGAVQYTFSACAEDARFDERPFIHAVAQHIGVTPKKIFPKLEGLFSSIGKLVWHHDEPFLSSSVFAEWCVFDLVQHSGVKVTLDGHGADELLAGYHGFFGARLAGLMRSGNIAGLIREMAAMHRRFGYSPLHLGMRMLDMVLPDALRQPIRRYVGKASVRPEWLDMRRLGIEGEDPFVTCKARSASVRAMSMGQLLHTSLPMQLHWADRDSMAHSVESRVPFLDWRLVEFVLGCPDDYKIRLGVTKQLLREGLRDLLPGKISGRTDKMGFVTPEEAWVREEAPQRFRQEVASAVEKSRGVLTPKVLERAEAIIGGRVPYNNLLWRWICFGHWMERFGVRV